MISDADLRQVEIRLPQITRKPEAFVPAIPLAVLQVVVKTHAEKALPLILAIHRQLQMTKREWTPISGAVWEAAGAPTGKTRAAVLRKLRALPDIIRIEPRRTAVSHYRAAKGPLWGT